MSEAEQTVGITVEQVSDFEFRVRFDDTAIPDLTADETPPVGRGVGPDPSRLLAAAVANCLTASLLFALRKYKNTPGTMGAKAKATLTRNEHGRLRITHIGVDLQLADKAELLEHLDRVLAQFEDFCIVTQSVRKGITVDVNVRDGEGKVLPVPNAG